jgi:hypothetical protein
MRLCQLLRLVSGPLPQGKGVVSVVAVTPLAVAKCLVSGGAFHLSATMWKEGGDRTDTTATTPR